MGLRKLDRLAWYAGQLTRLPPTLSMWPNLRHLSIGANEVSRLPAGLGEMSKLEALILYDNPIESLPESLSECGALELLQLSRVPLARIPEWLPKLPALDALLLGSVERGRADWTIPDTFVEMNELSICRIAPGNVSDPPAEVVARGLDAIKAHIRQRLESGKDFLTEAKLLILGEPGSGKTTLARRLIDAKAPMPSDDDSTEGIDVARWQIEGSITAHGRTEKRTIDVNIWDFGGQEIYHATHQFFLSRRSVYVVVADGRREDADFHFWLRAVELFGQDSPVLIVLNERSGRRPQIDIDRLRGRFPSLAGVITADLSKPGDIQRARNTITRHLRALPHLSDMLPKSWRTVRDALERHRAAGADHMTLKDYFALCAEHGFESKQDKLVLSQFLHDIGVCLHFQSVPELLETVILEPEWGTDAVYRVLDHEPIERRFGRFTFAEVSAVWSEPRYDHKHTELLALMGEFELCYRLPDGSAYIAPQLLSVRQPKYSLPDGDGLTLYYRYDFMPKGIITRFIVAAHDLIADQRHVWRNGVVLRRDDAWGEVIENYPERTITVRVVGVDRQKLTGIIDHYIQRIHRRFDRKLKYDTLVPCHCRQCQQSAANGAAPFLYPYARLARYAQHGRSVTCDHSFDDVDPRRLLDSVLPDRPRPPRGF